jgi:hypothetical protein
MIRQLRRRTLPALLAGALLATNGCFYYSWLFPAKDPEPGERPAGGEPRIRSWRVGAGGSAGVFGTSSEELGTGLLWGAHGVFWFNETLGVEFDYAETRLKTPGGGYLIYKPRYFSGILSLEDPWGWLGPRGRWRLGVGGGLATLGHTDIYYIDAPSTPVANIQVGAQWTFQWMRLLTVLDFYGNLDMESEDDPSPWEFGNMTGFRVGLEVFF